MVLENRYEVMDELDTSLNRLARAVAEIERACAVRENDVKARQQDLFSSFQQPAKPSLPPEHLVRTLDSVIANISTILNNHKEAA